jgi:hypothetical protein
MVKTLRSVVVTKQVSPPAMKYDRYGRRDSMRRDRSGSGVTVWRPSPSRWASEERR